MNEQESNRAKRRMRIVLGAAVAWAIVLFVWLLARGGQLPEPVYGLSSHRWAIMAALLAATGFFWIVLWAGSRKVKLSPGFLLLRISSDVLILALGAGVLLWNWSAGVLTILGLALAATYAARFARSSVWLIGRSRK